MKFRVCLLKFNFNRHIGVCKKRDMVYKWKAQEQTYLDLEINSEEQGKNPGIFQAKVYAIKRCKK